MKKLALAPFLFAFVAGSAQLTKKETIPNIGSATTINKQVLDVKRLPNIDTDLKITITKIEKDNGNFDIGKAGIYTIYYDITNTGMASLGLVYRPCC